MSGELILIIDDSREIVKHLTETVLPTFGYRTIHTYDGQSGLDMIREKEPDLVMLDFNLPQMTGLDVLQQMARESLRTPIVLMTGYGSELSAIEAFRLGAKDYIIKPFTVDEIIGTIDRALAETRLLHDKAEQAEHIRRLKVEMNRQNNEMRTLSNIGKAITTLMGVDDVLQRVLEAATYLTNAEESTIWLPDDAGDHLRPYNRQTPSQLNKPALILPLADSPAGDVMQSGQPLRQSSMSGQGMKVKTGYFAHAILYVPLQLRGINLGVLGVSNRTAHRAFSKQDEFLLSFLADYAAIALENARVFQAADQALAARLEELNTLVHITQTITASLDLDEVIHLTIKQVHDSWRIEASSLWLLNEATDTLYVLANVGTAVEEIGKIELAVGQGIVGQVVSSGQPIYTNDVASHEHHYHKADEKTGFHTRTLLCVPLIFRGKVIGAMQLINKKDGDFGEADLERARAIAAAIAIAVSNALLFDEAESRKLQPETAPQPCDILEIVTDVVQEFQPQAKTRQVALELTAEPGHHEIMGDPVKLHRAVGNLVENAIKYSPKKKKVKVTLAADPEHVLIQIEDSGAGIAKRDLPHIFKKFYQGQAGDETSSGQGLALAQWVADLHGGHLWAESNNGRGSIFYFELPRMPDSSA